MHFLALKDSFELKIQDHFRIELLELHYAPYSFGSGMAAYQIGGRVFKMVFDGRENYLECLISAPHEAYEDANWTIVFSGQPSDFLENGIADLKKKLI